MKIETERLIITALTARQLGLWLYDMKQLEKELNCSYRGEGVEGFFGKIIEGQLDAIGKDRENYIWYTFWFIIRKVDNVVIGSADFKNVPDQNGEVEIGYGLGKEFEHNGYMSETVQGMCSWAEKEKGVKHIIAETELEGEASQRILKRCGFTEYLRKSTVWWKR